MVKAILKGVGILVLTITVVVVGWKQFLFDEAALRQQIIQQAADHGYPLEIHQPLAISLFPQLVVEIREAQLQGTTPHPIEMDLLQFSVALFPLLKQELELTELVAMVDGTQWWGEASVQRKGEFVRFTLQGDRLNLDRYLPEGSTAVDPVAGSAAGVVQLPLKPLRALDLEGQVSVGRLHISALEVSDVVATIQAREGVVTIDPMRAVLYGGEYSGTMAADVSQSVPQIHVEELLQQVDLAQLLTALADIHQLQGRLTLQGTLEASGVEPKQLLGSLDGRARLQLDDGVLAGFNLNRVIRQTQALIEGRSMPIGQEPNETRFKDLSASVVVEQGRLQSDDLKVEMWGMVLQGEGEMDLLTQQLDYRLRAQVDQNLSVAQQRLYGKLAGQSFPVEIKGALASPVVKVDLDQLLKQNLHRRLQQKLGDKLQQFISPAEGGESGSNPSPEEQLKKGVGELLQKLF